MPEALDLFDADAIRFFLTINAPESRDTDFSWDEFQRRNNDELVATYGNAVHRLLSFAQSRFGGVVPQPGPLTPGGRGDAGARRGPPSRPSASRSRRSTCATACAR